MSLRERIPLVHKQSKSSSSAEPIEGSIVIVKDDNLPQSAWKLGKIIRLITSRDAKIRTAEVQLPSQTIISRAINHLYPLELPVKSSGKKILENVADKEPLKDLNKDSSSTDTFSNQGSVSKTGNITTPVEDKSNKRKASVKAHKAIQDYLNEKYYFLHSTILFSSGVSRCNIIDHQYFEQDLK